MPQKKSYCATKMTRGFYTRRLIFERNGASRKIWYDRKGVGIAKVSGDFIETPIKKGNKRLESDKEGNLVH